MTSNAWYRFFLYLIYASILKWLPVSYARVGGNAAKRLRYFICKRLFAHCGKNVNVERGAYFGMGQGLIIGDNSSIGINCRIPNDICIGKDVMMGREVLIISQNHIFDQADIPMIQQGLGERTKIHISDDVWIGARSIILPNVKIEKGSVIGAGAVVTKSVAEYDIVAGNPGRTLRNRKIHFQHSESDSIEQLGE